MTTTNQAFIKAYRQDAAELSPIGPLRAVNGPRHRSARASTVQTAEIAGAEFIGSSVAYVSPGTTYELYELDSQSPAAQRAATSSAQAAQSPYMTEAFPIAEPRAGETIAAARSDRPSMPVRRPLSSFTNRARSVSAPAPLSLRPGTTIASFQWPDTCRHLLVRHGQLFDRVTDSLLAQVDEGRSLFGVIGLFRGVGCTTTTLCLAALLARGGRRVIVVDGNFRTPQLADSLGAQPTAWWQDVLEGGASLTDAIIRAEDDQLDLLSLNPLAECDPQRRQLWANGLQFAATAGALRHAYDLTLVDLGTFFDPISQPMALNLVGSMRIDAVVAVTGPDRQDPRDFESLAQHLDQHGCKLLGTIDNRLA